MIVSDAIIGGFAVDEASVYYTCENGLVRRAKKGLRVVDGNVPVNLAEARDNGTDVALGEKADLFWIAGNAIFQRRSDQRERIHGGGDPERDGAADEEPGGEVGLCAASWLASTPSRLLHRGAGHPAVRVVPIGLAANEK